MVEIAKAMKRTEAAVRQKAKTIGLDYLANVRSAFLPAEI